MNGKPEWPPVGSCVAHRGACGTAPENTVAGCVEAVRQGAGTIEIDLQRTADDELVVVHDSTLRRTTDIADVLPDRADEQVGALTLAELRKLDAGGWFDRRYRGATIPTLAELLDSLDGRATLLIELKWPERNPGIEAQLAAELRRCLGARLDAPDPLVAIQSTSVDRLRDLRELLPPPVPMCLMTGLTEPLPVSDFPPLADWVSAYVPLGRELRPGYVERIHEYGIRVVPWTIDAPEAVVAMRELGADAIITNHLPYAVPVLRGAVDPLPRTPLRIAGVSVPDERTVLRADADVSLAGWSLRNHLMRRQWLPDATLVAGEELTVPSETERYLDNYGDTLALYDPTDQVTDLSFYR